MTIEYNNLTISQVSFILFKSVNTKIYNEIMWKL